MARFERYYTEKPLIKPLFSVLFVNAVYPTCFTKLLELNVCWL